MFKKICILLLIIFGVLPGQDLTKEKEDISSLLKSGSIGGMSTIETSRLTASVNETEYIVDAGDVFLIKIDVPGPASRIFPVTVTSDGHVLLPEAPSVNVRMLPLDKAKNGILKILKKYNPNSEVEVFLYQVHPINVTVLGSGEDQKLQLLSSSRLFDAVYKALPAKIAAPSEKIKSIGKDEKIKPTDEETRKETESKETREIPIRRVRVLRHGEEHEYDVLRFRRQGDRNQNPYLLDNDVVIIPFEGEKTHSISIEGAVGKESKFEYLGNDKLVDVIDLAGGLLPTADSSRIELYRFAPDAISVNKSILDFKQDIDFAMMPDDRIFVRYKSQYHQKYQVKIEGEVNYPGVYAIEEGITTLTELIKRAGGLTDKALLRNAKIIRRKILLEDKELERLRRMTVDEMNDLEQSYFRLRTREDIRVVACDFEKLFGQNQLSEDVFLRDKDEVLIPEQSKIVFVSGGVISPGNVVYDQKWAYKEYITAVGGFNKKAKKGDVKIIKSKTGVWLDADKNVNIEEGDIIFVPERKERNWWEIFKEGLLVASQIATIFFIISNVSK